MKFASTKKSPKFTLFFQFTYPLFIFIVFSLIGTAMLIHITNDKTEALEVESNTSRLYSNIDTVRNTLSIVDNIADNITENYLLRNALTVSPSDPNYVNYIYNTQNMLGETCSIFVVPMHVFIYIPSDNYIISASGSGQADTFYSNNFSIENVSFVGLTPYLDNLSSLGSLFTTDNLTILNSSKRYMLKCRKSYINNKRTYILSAINYDSFYKSYISQDSYPIHIYNNQGDSLIDNDNNTSNAFKSINKRAEKRASFWLGDKLITYIKDSSSSLVYFSTIDRSSIFRYSTSILTVGLFNVLIFIVLSIVLFFKYSKDNILPAFQILSKNDIYLKGGDFFKSIEDSYSELSQEKAHIQNDIEYYKENQENLFTFYLFTSHFKKLSEAEDMAKKLKLQLPKSSFIVIRCHFLSNLDNENNPHSAAKDFVLSTFRMISSKIFIYDFKPEQLGLICFLNDKISEDRYVSVAKDISGKSFELFKTTLQMTISLKTSYDSLLDISSIMHNLKYLEKNKPDLCDNGVLVYDPSYFNESCGYYLPFNVQEWLIDSITNGDVDRTVEILNNIYDENMMKRSLNIGTSRFFLSELFCIFYKIENLLNMFPELKSDFNHLASVFLELDIDKAFMCIFDLANNLTESIFKSKQDNSKKLSDQIIAIINDNYSNPDFGMNDIIQKVNFSYSYISSMFKLETNMTIFGYIEFVRIETAKKLLTETTTPVTTIAQACGYNSSTAFCRAFKKICDTSPGSYRKLHTI